MHVLTDSDKVKARRKTMLELVLQNHPVDCGVCDKAGECMLQDYHYEYNGAPSVSTVPKVRATKFHELSKRIVLDNERCVLCSRCVRFTREISKSHALGIVDRGDHSLVRCDENRSLDDDPYSDNVVDICPVGALLSRSFLYKSRVWYLDATPSVCPGCARGCNVDLWHRKREWKFHALDPARTPHRAGHAARERRGQRAVDLQHRPRPRQVLRAPRAARPDAEGPRGRPRRGRDRRRARADRRRARPVALVSSWGSNEELAAFTRRWRTRFRCHRQAGWLAEPGERIEDDILIRADKNPNTRAARGAVRRGAGRLDEAHRPRAGLGRRLRLRAPARRAKTMLLYAFVAPENGHADVFFPVSVQTERAGHYTNFEGKVSAFSPCFPRPPERRSTPRRCSRASARRRPPARSGRMIQDLVVYAVFIGYAIGVLMTFG